MAMTRATGSRRKPEEEINLLPFMVDAQDPEVEPFVASKRSPDDRRVVEVVGRPGKI
jgi:hypothetical protein